MRELRFQKSGGFPRIMQTLFKPELAVPNPTNYFSMLQLYTLPWRWLFCIKRWEINDSAVYTFFRKHLCFNVYESYFPHLKKKKTKKLNHLVLINKNSIAPGQMHSLLTNMPYKLPDRCLLKICCVPSGVWPKSLVALQGNQDLVVRKGSLVCKVISYFTGLARNSHKREAPGQAWWSLTRSKQGRSFFKNSFWRHLKIRLRASVTGK